jgi:hypothetical protein
LAKTYFKSALRFCKLNGIEPSLLLHPLDFLGADDVAELAFFPGMSLPGGRKVALAEELLRWMGKKFQCVTMDQHAQHIQQRRKQANPRALPQAIEI